MIPLLSQSIRILNPVYAIVDIETTGGFAANNGITEIAIVLHDGKKPLKRFETLVNPGLPIPRYIQALTGITEDLVASAPPFVAVAGGIHELLKDAIFLAHNVNFDYSFIKYQLESCGFELNTRKLCTVRLSRKIFPGLPSYSLGNLCRELAIPIPGRHRAGGDVDATVLLFEKILLNDKQGHVQSALKGRNKEQYLPPNLAASEIDRLPYVAGVYYFHDQKGKVIYVGKAKNLKNRVRSHFSNNKPNLQKQEFLRTIYSISFQESGTELMAYLLECVEIRRLWPKYNRSLKRFEQVYGIYIYEDRNGYLRLAIEKRKRNLQPVYSFSLLAEGQQLLRRLVKTYGLCPKLCFIQNDDDKCQGMIESHCAGACEQLESADAYNRKLKDALESLSESLPSFVVRDAGRNRHEQSCILVEKGRFYGMGFLDDESSVTDLETLKNHLTPYPENDYMRGLVYQHIARWPQKKVDLNHSISRQTT